MAGLKNTWWQLVELREHDAVIPVLEGTRVTVMFGADSVSGSGGCNDYGAEATYTPGSENGDIAISKLMHTEMFCADPPGVSEQENTFFSYLLAARTFEHAGNRLTLAGEGIAQPSLLFARIRGKQFAPD